MASKKDKNALLHASENGRTDNVRALLNRGINVRHADADGRTALILASKEGHPKIVMMLLEKGIDVDHKDEDGWTALHHASVKGRTEIVRALLIKGATITPLLKEKILSGQLPLDILPLLFTAFFIPASKAGDKDTVRLLLDKGADVNYKDEYGFTALLWASQKGHKEIVQMLLEKGAKVNHISIVGVTAILLASDEGHTEIVRMLLEKGAEVNHAPRNGKTALILASLKGHKEIARLLLDKGAEVNPTDEFGRTALLYASPKGYKEIVQMLLDKGAEVNHADKDGWTALTIASRTGHKEIVQMLLDKGAEVNHANNYGWTALLNASLKGHKEIVQMLLDKGAEVNHANNDGRTALILASDYGSKEIVQMLLDKGAEVNHADEDGETALLKASLEGHTEIVRLLLEKGARITPRLQEFIDFGLFRANILELLAQHSKKEEQKEEQEPWKGWSRADVAHFQTVFLDAVEANNNVVCPICLKYVNRSDGCMYMSHNCRASGGFYHKELYQKYTGEEGKIEFCTICGRICAHHLHYDLSSPKGRKSSLFDGQVPHHQYFGNDCQNQGGGGIHEKVARFIAIRNKAAELNSRIGQITRKDALEQIVEAAWSAPMDPKYKDNAVRQLEAKKFNVPNKAFPLPSELEQAKNINWSKLPDVVPRPGAVQSSLLKKYGTNMLSATEYVDAEEKRNIEEDDVVVKNTDPPQLLQFRHKDDEGKEHPPNVLISRDSLVAYINGSITMMQGGEPRGTCFGCKARLYPQEIKEFVPPAVYERYRGLFNYVFGQKEGGRKRLSGGNSSLPFFTEITNGACLLPPSKRSMKKGGKGWKSRKHPKRQKTQKTQKTQMRHKSHKRIKKTQKTQKRQKKQKTQTRSHRN